ncbi:hypothetical protein [Actinacidiphila bryophytorum]|uniref:hypothetical protein n=1 Tax=Actinacidiphila bryophytorum TaxID=1436133 RepID=UPI002176B6D7|nr:hypothetical protein [Actinacidiphila bryophytorum]UWE10163.1 hypothetical protein NYE86_16555 [Actinacidiphila bryophytorum]
MDAELAALAAAGATALVEQMAGDAWTQVRDRVVAFFARRGGEEAAVEGELATSREELHAVGRADVEAMWRIRLRRALAADPSAAAELRTILDDLAPGGSGLRTGDVHNVISGGVQHGPVIQAGNVGAVTFGAPDPRDSTPT